MKKDQTKTLLEDHFGRTSELFEAMEARHGKAYATAAKKTFSLVTSQTLLASIKENMPQEIQAMLLGTMVDSMNREVMMLGLQAAFGVEGVSSLKKEQIEEFATNLQALQKQRKDAERQLKSTIAFFDSGDDESLADRGEKDD